VKANSKAAAIVVVTGADEAVAAVAIEADAAVAEVVAAADEAAAVGGTAIGAGATAVAAGIGGRIGSEDGSRESGVGNLEMIPDFFLIPDS
jgi:hypothetical protein